jgi:hypothetical protein
LTIVEALCDAPDDSEITAVHLWPPLIDISDPGEKDFLAARAG